MDQDQKESEPIEPIANSNENHAETPLPNNMEPESKDGTEKPKETPKKVTISETQRAPRAQKPKNSKLDTKKKQRTSSASAANGQPHSIFPQEPKRKPVIPQVASPNRPVTASPLLVDGILQPPKPGEKRPVTSNVKPKKSKEEPLEPPKFIGMANRAYMNKITAYINKKENAARSNSAAHFFKKKKEEEENHRPLINKKSQEILKKKTRGEKIEDSLIKYGKETMDKRAKAKEAVISKSEEEEIKLCTFRPSIDKM